MILRNICNPLTISNDDYFVFIVNIFDIYDYIRENILFTKFKHNNYEIFDF
jgi:hypothetical protein